MKKYLLLFCLFSELLCPNCKIINKVFGNNTEKSVTEKLKDTIWNSDVMHIFNLPLISKEIDSVLNKYPDFKNVIKRANIKVPIFDNMIPQGMTIMNSYILITAYDEINQENSKCYVLNQFGEVKNIVDLNMKSHVGGIAYDKKNNLIWIPDNDGVLNAYYSHDFITKKQVEVKYQFKDIASGLVDYQNEKKNLISYLCIYDKELYIGSFSAIKKGVVKKYNIVNKGENLQLEYVDSFFVPTLVQGITFYKKDNSKYLILSRSYGRNRDSYIEIYQYKEDIKDYTIIKKISLVLPPMLEQISSYNDKLYIIFESNAKKYQNSFHKVENICVLSFNKTKKLISEKDI